MKQQQPFTHLPNLEALNQFSASVEPTLSARLNGIHQQRKQRKQNTIVPQQIDTQGVAKTMQKVENKKAMVQMEPVTNYQNVFLQ